MLRWALQIGRTPRELLASTTSDEITEMIAFERLEPFGALADQAALGQICAVIANVERDVKAHPEGFGPDDFMPALRRHIEGFPDLRPAPVLDPEALSRKLDAVLFGVANG